MMNKREIKIGGRTGRKGSSGKNIIPGLKSAKYSVVGPRRILRGAFSFAKNMDRIKKMYKHCANSPQFYCIIVV